MLMLFLTVALVHLIALMSPGPDFFFVSQTAASRSRREAMMGVVGISLGIVVWAGVALMGAGAGAGAAVYAVAPDGAWGEDVFRGRGSHGLRRGLLAAAACAAGRG